MEAIVHARKHLAAGQDTQFGLRAAGLLAYRPDTTAEPYRVSRTHLQTLNKCWPHLLIIHVDHVQPRPILKLSSPIPPNPPYPLHSPTATTPAHRTLSRPLRPQDSSLSQRPRPKTFYPNWRPRLPNLQYRAQCSRTQRALRTSYEEFYGRGSCGLA